MSLRPFGTLLLAATVLAGCRTFSSEANVLRVTESPELTPIVVPASVETQPIAFHNLILRIPRGSQVGLIQGGFLCEPQGELFSGERRDLASDTLEEIFQEELEAANYRAAGPGRDLFGGDERTGAAYVVAGAITHLELNACYPRGYGFSGGSGTARMDVEWQVFDTLRREVVLTLASSGSAIVGEVAQPRTAALEAAFAAATRNLLADRHFYDLAVSGGGAAVQEPARRVAVGATRPVALTALALRPQRGRERGRVAYGPECRPGRDFTPADEREAGFDPERLDAAFRQAFTDAGYEVAGDPSDLFDPAGIGQADYLLGAQVTALTFDFCMPYFSHGVRPDAGSGTGSGSARIEVEWQVLDALQRDLVLRLETAAEAELSTGTRSIREALVEAAFAAAAQQLLAEPSFTSLLTAPPSGLRTAVAAGSAIPPASGAALRLDRNPGLGERYLEAGTAVVRTGLGHGSGFLVTPELLVTGRRVVGTAERVRLRFIDGRETDGTVAYLHPRLDLALVRLETPATAGLSLASSPPRTGTEVFSYGTPLGEVFAGTLRRGSLTGTRQIQGQDYLLADAPVDGGTLGGPLLDRSGNVVGIATWSPQAGSGEHLFIPVAELIALLNAGT